MHNVLFFLSYYQEFKGHCPNIMEIDNGAVKMTGRRYYDTVTVTCEDGYQYTGSTVRVCQGDGSWSGRVGVCQGNFIYLCQFIICTQ